MTDRFSRARLRLLTSAFVLCLAASLHAEDATSGANPDKPSESPASSENEEKGMELQRIEIIGNVSDRRYADSSFATTKTEVDIIDIGQSISTITSETIEEQGLQRLNDAAPFAAGVNEFSVYDDLTIRGFRSFDDRRVNGMRTYNNFWSQTSVAHLERIEIIKGPAAATFGDASPGGVVNLVTKKPLPTTRREISASIGSYDSLTGALDVTGPIDQGGEWLYRLTASAEDADSFRNQVFNETFTVAPSFSWLPGSGTRLNLNFVYTDASTVLDRGQPNVRGGDTLGRVPQDVSITQPGDGLDTTDTSVNLTFDQDLGARWALTVSHMYHDYDEKLTEHRTTNRYLSDTEIELGYNDRDTDAEVNATTAYVSGDFETGRILHRLVVGADYSSRDDRMINISAGNVGTFDVLDPQYFRRDIANYDLQEASWSPWETSLETIGYYLHDQVEFGNWIVLAGLRYDEFESFTRSGEQPTPVDTNSQVSPRLSVTYEFDPERSVYASWLTGFEPQAGYTEFDGGPFDPSDSELFEIGYKQRAFDDRLLFTTSIYEITKNDIVVYANDENNPNLYRQRGQERSRGFELEVTGQVSDRLTVIANYAYNDAEVTEDSNPALIGTQKENAPRHSGTVWGRYDLGNGFGFGAGVTHVSERKTFVDELDLPAYTLFSAGVYYTAGDLQLALLGRNLTDREHWTGGYNFGRVFPGDPRTFRLSARYRF